MILANTAQRLEEDFTELVYVLIDVSPSMECTDYTPSRKAGAIKANQRLIETKLKQYLQDRVGIISFSGDAQLNHMDMEVCQGSESLIRSLNNLKTPDGGTNFIAPLELAESLMFGGEIPQKSKSFMGSLLKTLFIEPEEEPVHLYKSTAGIENLTRRIILLTDGQHNHGGSPEIVAERIKDTGVTIECVGIAGSRSEVDEPLLRKIASKDEHGQPRYSFIGDTGQLIKKYESMAKHIRPV